MPEILTPRQEEVLLYLVGFALEHLYQPTTREMADEFAVSWSAIAYQLRMLTEKGWIEKVPGATRAFEIPGDARALYYRRLRERNVA